MVPFGEKGCRCKSGDMEKMNFFLDMNIPLGQVDMSLEDMSDLEMSSCEKNVVGCCENFP